ncbi:predicted protein [Sclerotinia sclerotiorum 1980 UF-70]|uniref:Uncharacterized protein n=1 Tax=Sclerotinia sclerotiorum (strain ATCC 18683 / 1980 / Ss-1) TaxID=665079 RepID=A7EKX3_SCLS1|nr:predicted protein [Sclerotinia sclerotiorum 1980 UF-70]EDO03489.1 predicted protein [Sclerotinia sclerotiorum 1980 UF-70]
MSKLDVDEFQKYTSAAGKWTIQTNTILEHAEKDEGGKSAFEVGKVKRRVWAMGWRLP